MRRFALLCFCVAAGISGPAAAGGRTLNVSAAASLTDALQGIAKQYREPVVFNFGASSTLARQIEDGAPADVFISADALNMDRLARAGLIVAKSRINVVANTLAVVVPDDSTLKIREARDLIGHRIAIAQPDSVPAGIYARQYLRRNKVWDRLAPDMIPVENVRAALAAAESGDVDAAIVYKTDALISKKVKIAYEVSRASGPKIVYPAAILRDSAQKPRAQKFLDYLRSPAAREVFRRYGFLPP